MTNILLTGKNGQLGWELQHALVPLGNMVAPGRGGISLGDLGSIHAAIRNAKSSMIVDAASYTTVNRAESAASIPSPPSGCATP
jgi:dTDP-4-dehydrorhamnose reductase